MAFTIYQVPKEVLYVWNIQMVSEISKMGVGSEVWNNCQRIINKYPEWFPDDPKQEIPLKITD